MGKTLQITATLIIGINALGPIATGTALPKVAQSPLDNPATPEKVNLGRKLFFDARLSKDGSVSCNSCHSVSSGGTDNRSFSVGIFGQRGGRSAPTVINAAFNSVQFWDVRAQSLEAQAKGPLTNPVEMGMKDHAEVVARLAKIPGYVHEFAVAFPGPVPLTIDNLAKAIASYERTLITPDSPYDRYELGDKAALTAQQERGFVTMKTLGCLGCHAGANFSGPARAQGDGNLGRTALLATLVRKGELCMAVVIDNGLLTDLNVVLLADDRLGLYVRGTGCENLPIGALASGTDGQPTFHSRFFKALAVNKKVGFSSDSLEALLAATEQGSIAGILPTRVAARAKKTLTEITPEKLQKQNISVHRICLVSQKNCDPTETSFLADEIRRLL